MNDIPVIQLLQGDEQDGEKEHTGDAAGAEAGIDGEEGSDGMQAELVTEDLGLKTLTEEGDGGIGDDQTEGERDVLDEQFPERPWNEDGSGPEDGQSVDEGDTGGEERGIGDAQQEQCGEKFEKSEKEHEALGPEPAAEGKEQVMTDVKSPAAGMVGDLPEEKSADIGIGGGRKIKADADGDEKEQDLGSKLGEVGEETENGGRECSGQLVEKERESVQKGQEPRLKGRTEAAEPETERSFEMVKRGRKGLQERGQLGGKGAKDGCGCG